MRLQLFCRHGSCPTYEVQHFEPPESFCEIAVKGLHVLILLHFPPFMDKLERKTIFEPVSVWRNVKWIVPKCH